MTGGSSLPSWWPRPGTPARAALAGAVAASVLWGGAAYAAMALHGATGPDLHGYAIGYSPCAGQVFDPLARAVGAVSTGTAPAVFAHSPSLDRAQCGFSADAPGGPAPAGPAPGTASAAGTGHNPGSAPDSGTVPDIGAAPRSAKDPARTTYRVDAVVALHRLSDPRREFHDERALDPVSLVPADRVAAVRGLGDEAYALTFGDRTQMLKVRHGGAVLTLRLTTRSSQIVAAGGDVPAGDSAPGATAAAPAPDLVRLSPALVGCARAMLAALRG